MINWGGTLHLGLGVAGSLAAVLCFLPLALAVVKPDCVEVHFPQKFKISLSSEYVIWPLNNRVDAKVSGYQQQRSGANQEQKPQPTPWAWIIRNHIGWLIKQRILVSCEVKVVAFLLVLWASHTPSLGLGVLICK